MITSRQLRGCAISKWRPGESTICRMTSGLLDGMLSAVLPKYPESAGCGHDRGVSLNAFSLSVDPLG
jgi:hypothetical protein